MTIQRTKLGGDVSGIADLSALPTDDRPTIVIDPANLDSAFARLALMLRNAAGAVFDCSAGTR